MRITEKRLRHIIRSTLKEEATEDDVYGKYLFGDERRLPEPDTEEELELSDKFHSAFDGFMNDLTFADVKQLIKLRDEGKYTDILEVPSYAKRAWRVIEADLSQIPANLHPGIDKNAAIKNRTFSEAQLFTGNVTLPLHRYYVNSWTINRQSMEQLAGEDLGTGNHRIIFSLDLPSQKDKFLLNPGNMQQVNPNYFWQAEIWQVAPVVCDKWSIVRKDAGAEELGNAYRLVR